MARLDDDTDVVQIGDVTVFPEPESTSTLVVLTYEVKDTYYVGVDESLELKPKFPGYYSFAFNNRSGTITGTITKDLVNTTVYTVNATYSLTGLMETTTFTLKIEGRDVCCR